MGKKVNSEILKYKPQGIFLKEMFLVFVYINFINTWKYGARFNWRNNCTAIITNIKNNVDSTCFTLLFAPFERLLREKSLFFIFSNFRKHFKLNGK